MELALKTDPHCRNCIHLIRKGNKVICKGHWQDEIHPEFAGHKRQQLTKSIAIYEVTCPWYFPTHDARVKIETAIREMGKEIHAVKDYAKKLEKELHELKKKRTVLVKEVKKEKTAKKTVRRRPVKRSVRPSAKKKPKKKPVKRTLQRKALNKKK